MRKIYIVLFICCCISKLEIYSQNYLHIDKPLVDENNQIFISLLFKDGVNEDQFMSLIEQADSIIEEDMNIVRRYLTSEIGTKTFDIDIEEELLLFNQFNQIIGKAKFLNFEYREDEIEGKFCACYKPMEENSDLADCEYSLYASNQKYIDSSIYINDLNTARFNLIKELSLKKEYEADFARYSVGGIQHELALIRYLSDSANSENSLYETKLIRRIKVKEEIIFEINDVFILLNIHVIPIIKNGQPIYLFDMEIPDTDFFDILVVYYNNGYELTSRKILME